MREFIKYQEVFLNKLEGKNSNWDMFEMELGKVQGKLDTIMNRNELVPKLAQIEVMESEIEKLVDVIEDLKRKKEQKRRWL